MPDIHTASGAPRRSLVLIAVATTAVFVIVPRQLFDSNFYRLWEATNLLTGDRSYRDVWA